MAVNSNELKISIRSQLDALYTSFLFAIIFITALAWWGFDRISVIVMVVMYLLDLVPALLLHFEYWVENRGQTVCISPEEIIIKKGEQEIIVKSHDIRKITLHQTPSHSDNSGARYMTIGAYYFAHIYLKNGEDLILTSLLGQRLKVSLKKLKGVYFDEDVSLYNNLYRALN